VSKSPEEPIPGVTAAFGIGTPVTTTDELLHKPQEQRKFALDDAEVMVATGGRDIAEYAVMMAVILVLVAGTVRLIGSSATNTFATVGSSITQ
jgi:hypothetical protein